PPIALELLDGFGTVLATGTSGLDNLHRVVSNFVAPADGTYYVRIIGSGAGGIDYSLVATRDAVFDQEPNSALDDAQPMGGPAVALGHIGSGDAGDFYSFIAVEGQVISLFSLTPADGPGEFSNSLDPQLRLFDPSGALVASGV